MIGQILPHPALLLLKEQSRHLLVHTQYCRFKQRSRGSWEISVSNRKPNRTLTNL